MSVKDTYKRQIAKQIDAAAAGAARDLAAPPEGWIATMRKALGMSGAQLGKRLSLSRKRISQAEKAEPDGGVTLRSMHELAAAMNARFVYAILPEEGATKDIISAQAHKKASELVSRACAHMALEQQALEDEQNRSEIERVAEDLLKGPSSDLWEE
ncbi:MAG: mobile mystery protein A [Parvularculaceae bacterium]